MLNLVYQVYIFRLLDNMFLILLGNYNQHVILARYIFKGLLDILQSYWTAIIKQTNEIATDNLFRIVICPIIILHIYTYSLHLYAYLLFMIIIFGCVSQQMTANEKQQTIFCMYYLYVVLNRTFSVVFGELGAVVSMSEIAVE